MGKYDLESPSDHLSRDQESKIVQHLNDHFTAAAKHKAVASGNEHARWDRLTEAYFGKGYQGPKYFDHQVDIRANFIRATCELIGATLVGERPRLTMFPQEPDDETLAMMLDVIQDSDWRATGMDRELRSTSQEMLTIGTAFWKAYYDERLERTLGRRVNPRFMFVDSESDLSLIQWRMVAEIRARVLYDLAIAHPKIFDKDSAGDTAIEDGHEYGLGEGLPYVLPVPPGTEASVGRDPETGSPIPYSHQDTKIVVGQFWVREVGTLDFALDRETRRTVRTCWKRKSALVTACGDRILSIKQNPLEGDLCPYIVFRNIVVPGNFWGEGEVDGLVSITQAREVLLSRGVETIQQNINPPFIHDKNAGAAGMSELAMIPRALYDLPGGPAATQPMRPNDVSSTLFGMLGQLKQTTDEVSGSYASLRGEREKGIEAAAAVRQYAAQAQSRITPRHDDVALSIGMYGALYNTITLGNYRKKHAARAVGKDMAAAWDDLRKGAKAAFDIHVSVGQAQDMDPDSAMKFNIQAGQQGFFDDRMSVDQKIELAELSRKMYPNADRTIRKLKKLRLNQMNEEAKARAAEPEGGEPTGTPPQPNLAVVPGP